MVGEQQSKEALELQVDGMVEGVGGWRMEDDPALYRCLERWRR